MFKALPKEIKLKYNSGDKTMVCNFTENLVYDYSFDAVMDRKLFLKNFKNNQPFHKAFFETEQAYFTSQFDELRLISSPKLKEEIK